MLILGIKKIFKTIKDKWAGSPSRRQHPAKVSKSKAAISRRRRPFTKAELHMIKCKKRARAMIQVRKERIRDGILKKFQYGEKRWAQAEGGM